MPDPVSPSRSWLDGAGVMTPGVSVGVSESVKGSVSPEQWSTQYSVSAFGSSASVGYGGDEAFVETGSSFRPSRESHSPATTPGKRCRSS